MRIYESVFDISKKFLKKNSPVCINEAGIEHTTMLMLKEGPTKFPTIKIQPDISEYQIYKSVLKEFVGCAINYCYWYGSSSIRPLDCSSGKMYELVEQSFEGWLDDFDAVIYKLIELLSVNRFPLLEEREKHLKELIFEGENFCNKVLHIDKHDHLFKSLITTFPGYASDIFLKRASLFFIQMYRQHGWFESAMYELPVPSDYQVPKILKRLDCMEYDHYLTNIIQHEILIPKGSKEECSIRAATIIACKKLQEKTGWNVSDIDGWLWLKRKEVNTPFHLTITTDY